MAFIKMFLVGRSFVIAALLFGFLLADGHANDAEQSCENPEGEGNIRLINPEELATKKGENDSEIWLSIAGEVYDVTTGKDFYGPGAGYSVFAGRDATVPFISGKFTEEEGRKSPNELTLKELPEMVSWQDFYKTHETYKFVGHLVDPRYFDSEGKPTSELETLRGRIEATKLAAKPPKTKKLGETKQNKA